MKNGFRQSMAFLHTWSGLLLGWLCFAIFLTGTAAYLRPEITRWAHPELAAGPIEPTGAAIAAVAELQRLAPDSPSWFINVAGGREPISTVFWRGPASAGRPIRSAALDGRTGAVLDARESRGGEFFYRFHFQLHYLPVLWGRWLACAAAAFMLVAIISGVITHKRIFADFFTFRPGKGQRSWLDGHVATAVLALPFHAMITYTGLVTLMATALPWGIGLAYGPAGSTAFFAEAGTGFVPPRPANQPGTLSPLRPMLDLARAEWGGDAPTRLNVLNPGDRNSTVLVFRKAGAQLGAEASGIAFSGTTGTVLARWGEASVTRQLRGALVGLHIARFAGPELRTLFLIAGLGGTVMVGTGLVLWSAARRRTKPHAGHRLVDVLNVSVVAGLPIAMTAFFWANRLLPLHAEGRAEWEIHVFFVAWGLSVLHAALRPRAKAWAEQWAVGAALLLLLPGVDALTTDRGLDRSLAGGDWTMAGFDLGFVALGLVLAVISWGSGRPALDSGRQPLARAAE